MKKNKDKTKQKTLAQLIKDRNFEYENSDIKKHFTLEPVRSADYKLFHFNRIVSSEDAIKEMEKEGYVAANLTELLLWKDWNEQDWVLTLGSVAEVDDDRRVPCLSRLDAGRDLYLYWWVSSWHGGCRFLAVRNSAHLSSELESSETLSSGLPNELMINGVKYVRNYVLATATNAK